MSYPLRGGAFVGVINYFDHLLYESAAGGDPEGDAARMSAHFRTAGHCAAIDLVTRENRTPPTRAAIFKAARRLTRRVDASSYGVFYFAGHALETPHGLVLMGEDFESVLPFDTGVPLSRLFELLGEEAVPGAKFLCVLDCCRRRAGNHRTDPIPDHICVLYACESGGLATADLRGGFLTRELLNLLRVKSSAQHAQLVSFGDVVRSLSRVGAETGLAGASGVGQFMERVMMPIRYVAGDASDARTSVFVTLESIRFDSHQETRDALRRLRRLVTGALGFANEKVIAAAVEIGESGRKLRLEVPSNMHVVSDEAFLSTVLAPSHDFLYVMEIRWDRSIQPVKFQALRARLPAARWQAISKPVLSWNCPDEKGPHTGQLTILAVKPCTSATLSCVDRDGVAAPLRFLGPTLHVTMRLLHKLQ